jgi:hypothetical protein
VDKTPAPAAKTPAPAAKKTPAPVAVAKTKAPVVDPKELCSKQGKTLDKCGVCGGTDACLGCDKIANSGKVFDVCGKCGGDGKSCLGCDEIPNSGMKTDACGVCGGRNTTCAGCDGVPNSGATIDDCGKCKGMNVNCPCRKPTPCSGHGQCDLAYSCMCSAGWGAFACDAVASDPVEFTVGGNVEDFNKTHFRENLAKIMDVQKESVYISSVTAGSVKVGVKFVQTPTCPACDKTGMATAQNIAKNPNNFPGLATLGIRRADIAGQQVAIRGVEMKCSNPVKQCYGHPFAARPVKEFGDLQHSSGSAKVAYGKTSFFTPYIAGNYTVRVRVTDRCETLERVVTFEARCQRAPPNAVITNVPSQINYATLKANGLKLDGSTSDSPNTPGLELRYQWCALEGDPARKDTTSITKIQDSSKSVSQFMLTNQLTTICDSRYTDCSTNFKVQLMVTDGCSVSTQEAAFRVVCDCPPQVDGGAVKTIRMVGTMRGATGAIALEGRTVFTAADPTKKCGEDGGICYKWTLTNRSAKRGWIKDPVAPQPTSSLVLLNNITYRWGPKPDVQPAYTIKQNTSREISANSTKKEYYPYQHRPRNPRTSGFAEVATSERITEVCNIENVITPEYTFIPQCTVTLEGFDTRTAKFYASSYKECVGQYELQLEASDGCARVRDTFIVDVMCNKPPIALAHCNPYVVWNSAFQRFDDVFLDGRVTNFSFVEPNESPEFTWTVESAPAAAAKAVGQIIDTKSRVAKLKPSAAGTYSIKLTVDDGCSMSTDTVTVYAHCIDLMPGLKAESGLTSSQSSNQQAMYMQNLQFAVNTTYGTRGDKNQLVYNWLFSTGSKPTRSLAQIAPNLQGTRASFVPDFQGTYTIMLMVTDRCQTKNTTISFYVSCPSSYVIPQPTIKATGAQKPVNGVLTLTYDYKTKTFPTFTADATYGVTHSTGVVYKYRWVMSEKVSKREVTKLSSTAEVNDGRYQLDGKLLSPGIYSLFLQVEDGCQMKEFLYLTTVDVKCAAAPIPVISLSPPVQVGVTATAATTQTVRYDSTQNGFYRVSYTCLSSTVPSITSFACNWAPPTTGNIQVIENSGNTITLKPLATGTYSLSLTVDDTCPQSLSTKTVTIAAKCSRGKYALAVAGELNRAATIIGIDDANAQGGIDRVFSSWVDASKDFTTVTLNGTVVTAADQPLRPGDKLSYVWSLVPTDAGTGTILSGAGTNIVKFKPGKKNGRYRARMELSDGCQTQQFNFYIDTICPTLKEYLKVEAPVKRVSRWTRQLGCPAGSKCQNVDRSLLAPRSGGEFRRVDIHGLVGAEYLGLRDNLHYKWEMLAAPNCRNCLGAACSTCKDSKWGYTDSWETSKVGTASTDNTKGGMLISQAEAFNKNPNWRGGQVPLTLKSKKTTTCTQITTRNKLASLYSLNNINSNFLYDSMCFVPDVEGEYILKLTISDGCSSGVVNATVIAACNSVPNIIFEPRVGLVSLDGTNTRRVYVNANKTSDPDNDFLTYSWIIYGPDAKEISDVANRNGPIASFVPYHRGDYRAQLTVNDGCTSTMATEIVAVNCQESQLRLDSNVSVAEVLYIDGDGGKPHVGGFKEVTLTADVKPECNPIKKYEWSVANHQCAPPKVPPPTPAPTGSSLYCNDYVRYSWKFLEKPCTSNLGQSALEGSTTSNAMFTPDRSGTYRVRLTVADSCSHDIEDVTVTAMCSATIRVSTAVQNLLFGCGTDGRFGQATLTGTAEVSNNKEGKFVYEDASCQAPPVTPSPTVAPSAAPKPCCPSCPSCPSCSPCASCPRSCACGDTRGWVKRCGDKAVRQTVNVLRQRAVAYTTINGKTTSADGPNNADRCPVIGCNEPNCKCQLELRMVEESRDVIKNVCEWERTAINGFGAKSHKSRVFEKPHFHVTSRIRPQDSANPVSGLFIGVTSTLSAFLMISLIVNLVYLRKCLVLKNSMDSFDSVSRGSNESQ